MKRTIAVLTSLILSTTSQAESFDSTQIDKLIDQAMKTYKIPGLAVGVVSNGKIILNKGYGVQEVGTRLPVDQNTIFKIASNTKAFTAAALALLVDRGQLQWDSKVAQILPDFKLYDDWVTQEFTIEDLLTHRSGLTRFAGDLMLWPEPAGFTRKEIVKNLRHLKPSSSFRSEYAYDNLLYIVAGEVIAKVSGKSWETFVQNELLSPMAMKRCYAGPVPKNAMNNIAQPHTFLDDKVVVVKRNQTYDTTSVMAAAGGLKCSITDLLTWVNLLLNEGKTANDEQIISPEQLEELWTPRTLLSVSDKAKTYDRTHFRSYALGWYLTDVYGYKSIAHTGTLSGNLSYITLIPELKAAVVLLINHNAYDARTAIMRQLVHSLIGAPQKPWLEIAQADREAANKRADTTPVATLSRPQTGKVILPLSSYEGDYKDPWFGTVTISQKGKGLYFESTKSIKMRGDVIPLSEHQFYVYFDDRSLEADALIFFKTENNRVTGMTMAPASEAVDASFDYVDLDFTKQ